MTVRTNVQRTSAADLLYGVRSDVPPCFERVVGTTNGQASGGAHISEPHGQFSFSGNRVGWTGPGVGPWFWMETDYTVLCNAGNVPTGGAEFASVAGSYRGSMSLGPTVNVKRLGTSVFLTQPAHPQVGQQVTFSVVTTNVPNGDQVAFSIDGAPAGVGTVNNNHATLTYTPSSPGTKEVRASFVQTGTHGGSASAVRTMSVSQANVNSTVSVDATAGAKVGQVTQLTATVSPAEAGGTIVFSDQGAEIGSAPVGADGAASIDWIPQTAGERTIDADFSGRTGVNPSNGATSVNVAAADPNDVATNTTLAQIPHGQVGEQITLSATVDAGVAGGSVSFYDGSTLIGTAPVDGNGQATVNWTPSTEGDRTVRAVFSGHGVYLSSQATTQTFIAPAIVEPEPEPEPGPDPDPDGPNSGSLGSLTGSSDAGNASGSLGSLSNFGS
ncbi:Ig-like domain-containing protein [Dietzia aurantiaca]|uniref:Ig-like domain-containing protein n=1 Tax=Dietzia aurantiaca TaxID=983873 RepID=UPI001E595C71|nr:Ig-like domain-containing protein [Dietzia aurantiaca]MCD2263901.1 Ig-like domain-containing protein [Dietzia aurantiaca]